MVFSSFVAVNVGPELRGHLVDWVEKASFGCLSKLFEIDAKERQCKTLLTARNLAMSSGSHRNMLSIFSPGKCQKRWCLGSIIL